MERTVVYLSELKKIAIIYPGDIYKLAKLILQIYDVKDRKSNANIKITNTRTKSRPTLRGLARNFEYLAGVPSEKIENEFKARGFSLGSLLEFDPKLSSQD